MSKSEALEFAARGCWKLVGKSVFKMPPERAKCVRWTGWVDDYWQNLELQASDCLQAAGGGDSSKQGAIVQWPRPGSETSTS